MARGCHGRSKIKLEVKNWKETAKDRRTWRDLDEKAKTHKGLYCQMMMMMMISNVNVFSGQPSYLVPALNARTPLQCVASRTTDIQTQTTFTCPRNDTAGYQQ